MAADPGGDVALTLYLSLQPCHYSSNHSAKSCTLNLIQYYKEVLEPRGVSFLVVFAYPYRAHWEKLTDLERARYGKAIQNARDGIRVMHDASQGESRIRFRSVEASDWDRLVGFGDAELIQDWQTDPSESCHFTESARLQRQALDLFTKTTFDRFANQQS
ncbi:hypothetical protein HDV03_004289 [Kappamyces sp. JEL0829]|nr:hypothetical protein HDV03_004289 [Kappamyces sp. JEL0829]